MDERLERNVRTGLAALLDPIVESHPRWATSPAADRVLGVPDRSRRSERLTLLWGAVLVGLLLVAALAAALFVGAQLERDEGVLVLTASPTPSPKAPTTAPTTTGTGILATTKAGPLPAVATCPPGTDPDKPGPADQERPIRKFAYDQPLAFDRRAGRIVLLDRTTTPGTWTFDVCTNTWQRMHPDQEPTGAARWDRAWLVYDADSDRTVAFLVTEGETQTWAYDLAADRWTRGSDAPLPRRDLGHWLGIVYDPVSGLVVVREVYIGEMLAYDVDADRWTAVAQGSVTPRTQRISGLADRQVLGYDAAADRLILWMDGDPAWTFDPRAEAWIQDATTGPPLWYAFVGSSTASAYDEVFGRTLFFSAGGPRRLPGAIAYDAALHAWETLWTGSPCLDSAVACDAVNGRTVCLSSGGAMLKDGVTPDRGTRAPRGMVAFDAVERRWVTLLEPVEAVGKPAP